MALTRRQALASIGVLTGWPAAAYGAEPLAAAQDSVAPLTRQDGTVDWTAVRNLFPLSSELTHLACFLFAPAPRPVADAVERFRQALDSDPLWLEYGTFSEAEGRPFPAVKEALAAYTGGAADEIGLMPNTTTALALLYQGLRVRANQHILTTEHDHYSHHESIRYAAARSGCGVEYVSLYDEPAAANAGEMAARIAGAIRPSTRAVGVTWVHSSTGVKVPVEEIAAMVSEANRGRDEADRCLLIVDGVHGFANQDVDIATLGCDFFASGTHKWLLAPRGTGMLWGRREVWPEITPTIPTFDPQVPQTWAAWMNRTPLPPTQAAFVSPGGFVAFENLLAIPAATQLHRSIGRDRIAARIDELNSAFRTEASRIPGLRLHTPIDPAVAGPISCFEVAGLAPSAVAERLFERGIRTNSSPYKVSYARVSAGIMNSAEDIDRVVRELRNLAM